MFNLIITADESAWNGNPCEFPRNRIINKHEYTVEELANKYAKLAESTKELKKEPCIFAHEGKDGFFYIGYIKNLRFKHSDVVIEYELDKFIPALPMEKLYANKSCFHISSEFEFNRTHWALKDVDLFSELVRCEFITQELTTMSINRRKSPASNVSSLNLNTSSVFIVHGHDELAKSEAARFVEFLGHKAVILHEQISQSQTIIEKFEKHASTTMFAIVLLTPDDVGYAKDSPNSAKYRARQNVIFELGYFCAKLTRKRMCVLYQKDVEVPNDFAGVVYIPMDPSDGGWKLTLAREMKASGLNIDLNKLII